MSEGVSLRIGDLVYGIKKRWKLIIILTVLGCVVGLLLSGVSWLRGSMSRNYGITCSAVFIPQNQNTTYSSKGVTYTIDDYRLSSSMVETVRYVLAGEKAASVVIENMQLIGITPQDICNNLSISVYGETPVLEFKLNWRSADEGIAILNTLMDCSSEILLDTLDIGRLSIVNTPVSQYIVGSTTKIPTWGLTTLLGLLASLAVVIFEIIVNATLINLNDVQSQFELELIGSIPKNVSYFKKAGYLTPQIVESNNLIEENYGTCAYILKNRLGSKDGCHTIYITSTTQNEGKSSVAAHLALHLSEMEHRVLLIDFDLKNPSIGTLFTEYVNYENSFNALYRGEITKDEALIHVSGYLDVLPAILEHKQITIDTSVIDMLKDFQHNYDYILIDTPPVGEMADALSLNQAVDGTLFVIGFDTALKKNIQTTIEKLDKSGIRIIGSIVNKSVESSGSSYRGKNEPNGLSTQRERKPMYVWHKKSDDSAIKEENQAHKKTKKSKRETEVPNDKKIVYRNILSEQSEEDIGSETLFSDEEITQQLIHIAINDKEET